MTFPEIDEREEEQHPLNQAVVEALIKLVHLAVQQGRLTCGVQDCINLMGSSPDKVMLCLLAQNSVGQSQDASVKIQQVLIRAFCCEWGIGLLHVEDQVKLTQLILTSLSQPTKSHDIIKPPLEENSTGYACVMIEYPSKQDTSHDEDTVSDFIKHQLHANTLPYVTLPA